MSLQKIDNRKFSGLIKVNISRDTNKKQIIVNENSQRDAVNLDDNAVSSVNAHKSPLKIVRVVGEPVLATKKPRCSIDTDISIEANVCAAEETHEIAPFDDEPVAVVVETIRKYRMPDFVVAKSNAPKETAPERLGVETIFPNVCFHFLNGLCIHGDDCLDSHSYPQQKDVYAKLQAIGWENAAKLFRGIVSRCRGLLLNYFIVFARFFATKRQRGPLLDMLAVCEDPKNKIVPFMAKLIKAFVFSGLTYSQTIALVLKNHRRISGSTLSIIFNTDIVSDASLEDLLHGLELLNADPEYDFDIGTVNHLLAMTCEIGTIKMIKTMIKIFDRLKSRRPTIVSGIAKEKFKKFSEMVENCTKQTSVPDGSGRARICAP